MEKEITGDNSLSWGKKYLEWKYLDSSSKKFWEAGGRGGEEGYNKHRKGMLERYYG